MSKKMLLPFLATALLAFVTGCGDDSSSASGSDGISVESGSLTKAEFIKKAEEICEGTFGNALAGFRTYQREAQKASKDEKEAKAAEFVEEVVAPAYEEQTEQVTSLGVPSSDAEEIATIYEALQEGLDEGREDPIEFVSRASPFTKAAKLASKYGFTYCAGP